jgi:DNA-binding response OmpR family regulator
MSSPAKQNIAVVEDDVRLSTLICRYLETHDFRVTAVDLARPVVDQIHAAMPDLLILDLGLPGQDGLEICRRLRPGYQSPILILTARDDDIDQVLGLELGADDYVVKPIEPRVLLARIRALLRRSAPLESSHKVLRFGHLLIDTVARAVSIDARSVALSSNEFDLLVYMASRAGEIQSREVLFQHLYRREYDGSDRILDIRISHLRRKLGDVPGRSEGIKTIWGKGYLFVPGAW